jgi:copper chaperone NosL
MMNSEKKLSSISRWGMLICALALGAVLLVPMWRIDLDAPQYPEGLMLQIYPHKLGGDVDIINGLNHYIGMKTLHTEDFIEFAVLPYFIGAFAIFSLLVAVLRSRNVLFLFFAAFLLFGVIAMVDFWNWEYQYGHDLDPNAAIQIPGMAYQPPLIGFKQLLNFGAYSIPDIGGWIFIGVGIVSLAILLAEWKGTWQSRSKITVAAVLTFSLFSIQSCNVGPEPIRIGKDQCDFCKMKIAEIQFAAEVVSIKGKVYKFDDIICAAQFVNGEVLDAGDVFGVYASNHENPSELLKASECTFFYSEDWRSPMNGNLAAFIDIKALQRSTSNMKGAIQNWKDILEKYP